MEAREEIRRGNGQEKKVQARVGQKRVAILTGGSIDLAFAEAYLKEHGATTVIAVDKGLAAAVRLSETMGLELDYVVGDYDSVDPKILSQVQERFWLTGKPVLRTYPPEKDATDTELALSLALSLEPEEIVLLGATGTRFDHAFANIQLLYQALTREIPASIVDGHNRISLIDAPIRLRKKDAFGDFLSLIPLTEAVTGLTLTGMKYPLERAELRLGSSLGISNEIVEEEAEIRLEDGVLIVFETKD